LYFLALLKNMKKYWKRWRKKFLRSRFVTTLAVWVLVTNIWLVRKTTKWQYMGEDGVCSLIDANQPFLGCFWHGRLMLMPQAWINIKHPRRPRFFMLNSRHFDGQLIGRVTRVFGIDQHVGSTNHKGLSAFRGLMRLLKDGHCVGMTPDGPRGPAFKVVTTGGATLAMMAKVPIVPIAVGTSRRHQMDTWDKFLLSWPFGRGVVVWGEPIWAREGETAEELSERMRLGLDAASDLADSMTGRLSPRAG
jgi:lysophospholipid acyltransferase (LPLAT)-like uncharacterized protein